jgi:hypothetical protein
VHMFLRFLVATGRCQLGLDHAIPTMAHWHLASLPKYLPAEAVEHVLMSCDVTTHGLPPNTVRPMWSPPRRLTGPNSLKQNRNGITGCRP